MRDVRDYGALVDGVTDDTAAIQAAIDAGPGVVYVPAGVALISTLALKATTYIQGEHARVSELRAVPGNTAAAMVTASGWDGGIERIRLNGDRVNQTSVFNGLDVAKTVRCREFEIVNVPGDSIRYTGGNGGRFYDFTVKDGGGCGFRVSGAADYWVSRGNLYGFDGPTIWVSSLGTWDCVNAGNSVTDGWLIDGGAPRLYNCEANDNQRHGFNLAGCNNVFGMVRGESNNGDLIRLDGATVDCELYAHAMYTGAGAGKHDCMVRLVGNGVKRCRVHVTYAPSALDTGASAVVGQVSGNDVWAKLGSAA